MQCVILAGGLGTRMRAISSELPKSLIPVLGKPFIDYQLRWLKRFPIQEVLLCIGHKGSLIRDYVKDGSAWGFKIRYLDEGDQLRGTGGALRWAAEQHLLQPIFFLMYGDSFLPIDFQRVWRAFEKRSEMALMTVLRNQGQWDASNASFDGEKVHYNKMKSGSAGMDYIDYGLSILRRESILQQIAAGVRYDLADYFQALSERESLAGYEVKERFYEIGSPSGLADFTTFAASQLNIASSARQTPE